ncbi:MAG: MFS transporter [Candidatus Pacebacteria bacterium]|nr:MFS transporter [Candidatus Paceibacterota bacterium]
MQLKRNIKLLGWFNFFTDFVFFAPVAIIYFQKVTGSFALGMSIFSVAYVSSAIFEVPTGVVSDFLGRKKTTILGAACSAICIALYAVGISYWVLFLGALFQGLSRAFYSGNNDALLMDTLKETGQEKEYHSHLGKISSMFQIALAGAAIIGSLMASKSFALVMWASVVPQVCAFIVALKIKEPQVHVRASGNIFEHIKESLGQFKINNNLRLATIASALRFSVGESAYFLRQAFFKTLWPLWALGIPQMFGNICGAFSYYFSGKVINKFGLFKVLNFEIISNRIVNLIAIIFPTAVSPVLMASTSITFGVGSVATNSLLQKEFTNKQRATMGSLNSLAGNILFGIFAVLLGYIADRIGLIAALIVAQIILLIPLFYYRKILNK